MYSDAELREMILKYAKRWDKELYNAISMQDKDMETELQRVAEELVAELEDAFVDAQIHGGEHMASADPSMSGWLRGAKIKYTIKHYPDGKYGIRITFPGKYLFRQSLWADAGYTRYTGEGIRDIFALFTSGYTTSKKMPAGYWESVSRYNVEMGDGKIKAPNRWPAKPFISDVVDSFERKYPNLKVEYPEEWH